MDLHTKKRMAAKILKCGENRVWIDPNRLEDVADCVTREDIKGMINSGAIRAKQKRGVSKGRTKRMHAQKKKGRQKGYGSRKGGQKARNPKKEGWMKTIRPIRTRLKEMREEDAIDKHTYRRFYRQSKGGMFKSKAHLESHMKTEGVLNQPKE